MGIGLSTMTTIIRPATPADARPLSELGATTLRDAFGSMNDPDDMDRYIADAFTPTRQAAEIADPAGLVLLAEHTPTTGGAELIGYAQLVAGAPPPAIAGPAPMELKRFYVMRAWHGRGVAQLLMNSALDEARARGAITLWLGVWERNPRAIAFYTKYGFRRAGERIRRLGSDAQTDWLLARSLGDG